MCSYNPILLIFKPIKNIALFLSLTPCLLSCSDTSKQETTTTLISIKPATTFQLSEFIELDRIVALETKKTYNIGTINKLICTNSYIIFKSKTIN